MILFIGMLPAIAVLFIAVRRRSVIRPVLGGCTVCVRIPVLGGRLPSPAGILHRSGVPPVVDVRVAR